MLKRLLPTATAAAAAAAAAAATAAAAAAAAADALPPTADCQALQHPIHASVFQAGVGNRAVAATVPAHHPAGWTAAAVGEKLACTVEADGAAFVWHLDKSGPSSQNPTRLDAFKGQKPVQVAIAPAGLLGPTEGLYAVTSSGSVLSLSSTNPTQADKVDLGPAMRWTKVAKVSCGSGGHCMALGKNGVLVGWGNNSDNGQLGRQDCENENSTPRPVTQSAKRFVDVSCGQKHTAAVDSSGCVWVWGSNRWGQLGSSPLDVSGHLQPVVVNEVKNRAAASVACGDNHTLIRFRDGQVFSFGLGIYGQLGRPNLDHIGAPSQLFFLAERGKVAAQIAAGANQSAILTTNGELYIFGCADRPSPEVRSYLRSPQPAAVLALGKTLTGVLNVEFDALRLRGKKI